MLADFLSIAVQTEKKQKTLCVCKCGVTKSSDDKAVRRQQQWFVGHVG